MRIFRRCCRTDYSRDRMNRLVEKCGKCGRSLKDKPWWIDYRVDGRRRRELVGTNRRLALDVMAKRRVAIKEEKVFDLPRGKKHTLGEIIGDFLAYSRTNKRSHRRDLIIAVHLRSFFGDRPIEQISPIMIEHYKQKRIAEDHIRPATVNREIAALKCIFNWAIKNDKADRNPMQRVRLLPENNMRTRVLSQGEIAKLLDVSAPHVQRIELAALYTGMRLGEILGLTWQDVLLDQGHIVLKRTKSGKMRQIPISPAMRKVLDDALTHSDKVHVFCNGDRQPYKNFYTLFSSVIRRAGITDFRFHDLRHTAATCMVASGVDLVTIKEILGHASINMTMRYAHSSPEQKRQAVDRLGAKMDTMWTTRGSEAEKKQVAGK